MPFNTFIVTCVAADTPYPIPADHRKNVHTVAFQQKHSNTGRAYIGKSTLQPSTDTGIIGYMAVPAATSAPGYGLGEENAPNGVDLSQIFVASSQAGDIVYGSYDEM